MNTVRQKRTFVKWARLTEITNMLALTFENIFGREDTVRCIPVRMRC